jgi:hypothetical protein
MLIKYSTGHIYTAAADSHFPGSEYTIPEKKRGIPRIQLTIPSAKRKRFSHAVAR